MQDLWLMASNNTQRDLDIWPPPRLNDFQGQTGPLSSSGLTFYITVARGFDNKPTIYGSANAV